MASNSEIDVRDLRSVRKAAHDRADVVLGEDWVAPDMAQDNEARSGKPRRGVVRLNRSPLARKIIIFNLLAIVILVVGVLYLNPLRDNLIYQRANGLVNEAELIADVIEAQLPGSGGIHSDGANIAGLLDGLDLRGGVEVFVVDASGEVVAERVAPAEAPAVEGLAQEKVMAEGTRVQTDRDEAGETYFLVSTPVYQGTAPVGVVALLSAAGEMETLIRRERELILQMFVIGIVVSIGLSLVLASAIANPLADLAAAAELGRDRNARRMAPSRIRIPDMTARPDEIGRLSGALRGMVAALYERIEANEQFAADVSHEIKNPLASLRSAVGTMRVAKRDDQREKLLEVIEHDVRRLDRLVSDISNASRLDSELVREEEKKFELLKMLNNLGEFLGHEARDKGIEYISDLPPQPIYINGLEDRLAQVFVNLITNAISFCEEGDAIRVWARRRENRMLVVVEDTGPGIPEQALTKIFKRFYSERPAGQFGNNSGLGLAISKQIVEAHGGVIWAENIRPTEADITSEPLGARFVVGLPV
jgi:two-component system sensor histidine kinase ChvG